MARKHGLKVLLGVWLSSRTERNWSQMETGIALAKRFPDVITAVVVGNEALLRGEISAADLAAAAAATTTIEEVMSLKDRGHE